MCVHVLGGHKDAVNDIAVHPSGKLALTVSKDNTMKLWNLVHGRCGFTRRLKGSADRVAWDASGAHYLLLAHGTVQVYAAADNSCLTTMVHPCRVSQALFADLHYGDGESDADPASSLHFVTLTADTKTLYVYTLAGAKVASLSLESLGGRPKDMQILKLDVGSLAHPVQSAGLAEALMQAGELAVVASSAGGVHVLSLEAACRGLPLEACVLTSTQLRAEPRLVSLAVTPCYRPKTKHSSNSNSNSGSNSGGGDENRKLSKTASTSSGKGGAALSDQSKGGKRTSDRSDSTNADLESAPKKAKKDKKNKKPKANA